MMKKFLWLLIVLLWSGLCHTPVYATTTNDQYDAEADSLKNLVDNPEVADSVRLEALITLAWSIRSSEQELAKEYVMKALEIARDLDDQQYIGRSLTDLGLLYWRKGDFKQAYENMFKARQLFEDIEDDEGYARVLINLGVIFHGQGYYDNALEYYFEGLQMYEDRDDDSSQFTVLNNIGYLYQEQEQYDKAEEYHRRALNIAEKHEMEQSKAYSLNNLGIISQHNGNHKAAHRYFSEALNIRLEYNDIREIAITQKAIGNLYIEENKHDDALDILREAQAYFEQAQLERGKAQVARDLGSAYMAFGELDRAKDYFFKSIEIADEADIHSILAENYDLLSRLMHQQQQYKDAYEYQQKHISLKDSIYDEESRRRVMEMQLMYDRERQQDEIDLLQKNSQIQQLNLEKQRQSRNYLLLFMALILLLLVILYYRFIESRRTNKKLKTQKEEISRNNEKLKELNDSLIVEKKKVDRLNKQLQENEKNLIETNQTKDKFFSIISHDLRNPFASVLSFSRLLKRDIDHLSKEELKELASELDRSVLKINNLLENLLQWSRAQTGKIQYNPERFNIKDVIRDNVRLFEANTLEKNIDIFDRVHDGIQVWGDVNMTDTIVRNLLSNALKYTYPGGYIEIRSHKHPDMIEIAIADNGVGISEEDQDKLFRVDSLHSSYGTSEEKGSGLGLLLCKEFAQKQGGNIYINSKAGKGSVVSFTIPVEAPSDGE